MAFDNIFYYLPNIFLTFFLLNETSNKACDPSTDVLRFYENLQRILYSHSTLLSPELKNNNFPTFKTFSIEKRLYFLTAFSLFGPKISFLDGVLWQIIHLLSTVLLSKVSFITTSWTTMPRVKGTLSFSSTLC